MTLIKHISLKEDPRDPDARNLNGRDLNGEEGKSRRSSRRKRSGKRPLKAFLLSGGGARGAYECGVYQSLVNHGIEPDILVGTSVGAINATAIAMGMSPETLTEIWLNIASPSSWLPTELLKKARTVFGNENVFRNRRDLWNLPNWTYLFDTHPLKKTLARYFHADALDFSDKQLLITAVEIQSGQFKMFRNEEITLDHVLASASIPVVFPWTRIGPEIFWDGGLLANVPPLRTAIEADPQVEEIYMVKLFPTMGSKPTTLIACIERAIEIMLQGALNNEVAHMEFMNRLIDQGSVQGDFRQIKLHSIEFHEPLDALSIINFDYNHVRDLVAKGKRDADLYFLARDREETSVRRRSSRKTSPRTGSPSDAPSQPDLGQPDRREAGRKARNHKRARPRIHATRRFPTGPRRVEDTAKSGS